MRSTRWFIASMASGILVIAMLAMSGVIRGSRSAVVIEWGMAPEILEGCEVEIDGEVAGTLRHVGAASRTGFEVKDGTHTIAILHPEYDCEPRSVTTGGALNQQVMLVADVGSETLADGSTELYICFPH
ncbi:MAG: hypothetical protein KC729_01885 [Candidatus Eisenbacteria bacterium]|uniref:Uncharacterized protein n=1 Tax=Eiseniibacteriota bacterium TaxID=2212470 RepID=A0A956RNJ1_UNCEI|nr:hypothetical protein [Candidatus Eisenbacteria bacterium]